MDTRIRSLIDRGLAIPASPLALNRQRRLDERRQRALYRYYSAAGAGGIAVGVHTTQFAIRAPSVGLFQPVLALASAEMDALDAKRAEPLVRIAGICGPTPQAVSEALTARDLRYHAGLLSLAAMHDADDNALLAHCLEVSRVMPIVGFYLQSGVGGRAFSYAFWRRFAEIPNIVAIKMAPFNRYQTIDVMRAVAESGRSDIALYTGNDDNIVCDLITEYTFHVGRSIVRRRIVGGLLGHWSVWTHTATRILKICQACAGSPDVPAELLSRAIEITDANAAFFDAAGAFAGCIAGLHEVLRRQGLLEGTWCLDPKEGLSPGQFNEIERVYAAYPHLNDDVFVSEHLDQWLK